MIQALHKILGVLFLFTVVACSADISDTPASTTIVPVEATAQLTSTVIVSSTPTPTLPQTPLPVPTGTTVPLAEDDAFLLEMQEKGYSLAQSGSITDEHGVVYSAYILANPKADEIAFLGEIVKETCLIAFYRWDGAENRLLNIFHPPAYDKRFLDGTYPRSLNIVNWDDPFRSFGYIDFMVNPDEYMPSTLRINGFASDINHNGKPEFMFTTTYCPISCSRNRLKTHIYEISSDTKVIELAANLPGHIDIYPISFLPLLYVVDNEQWYGFTSEINIPSIYQWQDNGFVDVTIEYADLIQADIQSRIDELETFNDASIVSEREQELSIELLQMYQRIEMGEEGLQSFLELTQLDNWPDADQDSLCWLQVARATARDEYESGESFSIPHSTFVFNGIYLDWVQGFLAEKDLSIYDVSACTQD